MSSIPDLIVSSKSMLITDSRSGINQMLLSDFVKMLLHYGVPPMSYDILGWYAEPFAYSMIQRR